MATYDITDEIHELAELGVTGAEAEARLGDNARFDEDGTAFAWGRSGQASVYQLLDEARARHAAQARRAALTSGALVEWRKLGGAWLLAGAGLTKGQIVTVTRRDGSHSDEVVGEVVAERDGLTYARVGRI